MTDTHSDPQMRPMTLRPLESSRHQALKSRLLKTEKRAETRFAKNLGSYDGRPGTASGKPATPTDTEEQFAPIGTARHERINQWTYLDAKLTRIGECPCIACR